MTLAGFTARKLTPNEMSDLVNALIVDCKDADGLKQIILFGSASRGEMTEASDLDAVLIFDSPQSAKKASRTIHNKRISMWPRDVICVDSENFQTKSQIGGVLFVARTEGRVIFEA